MVSAAFPDVAPVDFPRYRVVDEEARTVFVSAELVTGFFVDPDDEVEPDVAFLGVHQVDLSKRKSEHGVLEILNRRQEKIGEYFIGRILRRDSGVTRAGDDVTSVSFEFFGNRCEYPEAAEIWQRWASGTSLEAGEWSSGSAGYQNAWLHVVQNSWFASKKRAARYGPSEVAHLDGTHFSTRSGFYCALGEAVNGPGGYFGSNLDALADCVSSDCGEGRLARLVWQSFSESERLLGSAFLGSVLDIMRENSVDVVTS